jgi:hypothetical protein
MRLSEAECAGGSAFDDRPDGLAVRVLSLRSSPKPPVRPGPMAKDGRRSRDFFPIVPHAGENAIHLLCEASVKP